jgi:molybdate transport system ATP-binding protein
VTGLAARVLVRRSRITVDVALEVAVGETVAVMGPSGAGKSTLLGALAGLIALDEGEIRAGERVLERTAAPRIRTAPMKRGVVLLGQDPRLFPHLTARENVAFGPRAAGMQRPEARAAADAWLARVGLPSAGERRPAQLSGGEQQRVAVARALAASPRAVLLDEPLVALDPETAADIRSMLRDQLADTTVVAVTHDAVDAAALADRLVVLEEGRVTQSGAVRDVLAAPATRFVAAIAGLNRVEGVSSDGGWERDGVRLDSTDAASRALAAEGGRAIAAVFRPGSVGAVAGQDVRAARNAAGPRNTWTAAVDRLEPTPAGIRLHAGWCTVDLDAASAIGLAAGSPLTLSVDPADVRFLPLARLGG